MKRALILTVLILLTIPVAVWAEGDRAFSSDQEKKIRQAIHAVYPNGVKILVEDIGGGQTRIVCWAKYSKDYFLFTASPGGNLQVNEISPGNAHRTGIRLEEEISRILNPSAGEELGRDLIK